MSVKVGSARIDENGRAHGGKAGNQNGKEISTQNWYRHKKGWILLRPIDSARAEKIAECMESACKNKYIGYDQYERNTLYDVAKKVDFDCSKVTTLCETDCSALVRVCCAYAGIMVGDIRTTNQANVLMATGHFQKMTTARYTETEDYLLRGDILVTKTQGHTVVVLTDGKYSELEREREHIQSVCVTGMSVFVRSKPSKEGDCLGIVYKGDSLTYVKTESNGWYCILYKDKIAYITNKYTIPIYG